MERSHSNYLQGKVMQHSNLGTSQVLLKYTLKSKKRQFEQAGTQAKNNRVLHFDWKRTCRKMQLAVLPF